MIDWTLNVGSLISIGTIIVGVAGSYAYQRFSVQTARKTAEEASNTVRALNGDLQAHRLYCAETYATKHGLTEQMTTMTKAIHDLGERVDRRLDGMNERLDRVIESNRS